MNYNNYECTICNQDMNPYYSKFQNHKIPNSINPLMLFLISQLRHIPPCHNYWLQLKEVGSMWLKYWASWGSGVLDWLHTSPLIAKENFIMNWKTKCDCFQLSFFIHFKGNQWWLWYIVESPLSLDRQANLSSLHFEKVSGCLKEIKSFQP
jgi:hypothetical protein